MLGLKGNEDIKTVKSVYRTLLKQKLPKLNDNSEEGRKIIEAFQQIAEHFGADPSTFLEDDGLGQHLVNLSNTIESLKGQIKSVGGKIVGESFSKELLEGVCASISANNHLSEMVVNIVRRNYSTFSTARIVKIPTKQDPASFTVELTRRALDSADVVIAKVIVSIGGEDSGTELTSESRIIKCIPATIPIKITTDSTYLNANSTILETIGKRWKLSVRDLEIAYHICKENNIPLLFSEVKSRVEEARLTEEIKNLRKVLGERQHEVDVLDSAFPSRKKLLT